MAYKEIRFWKIKTSDVEIKDIIKGWLVISVIFSVLNLGIRLLDYNSLTNFLSSYFWVYFLVSLITVGIGFLFHELAHKFVAQHYGCAAEFRADNQFLFFAFFLAILFGFTFIAPGAVLISGMITRKENGIISIAGPLTNFCLAIIFLLLSLFLPVVIPFGINSINLWATGYFINLLLGLFNLIPVLMFDGKKIFDWNVLIWLSTVALGVILLFVPAYL